MSDSSKLTHAAQHLVEPLIIISTSNNAPQIGKIARICWNTGEEKNCASCYLGKSCKAKT